MDIYHTKKQTENISRSFSYLLLKILVYFISQCISMPYLESGLCNLGKELDKCNFTLFSQETDFLIKVIKECVNIKLWDILGCFHYILNPPRIVHLPYLLFTARVRSLSNNLLHNFCLG